MTFYVHETNTTTREKLIRRNGRYYSAFIGSHKTVKQAQEFLRKCGDFWEARGKKLMLFNSQYIKGKLVHTFLGYAKGSELILSKSVFDAEERERLSA